MWTLLGSICLLCHCDNCEVEFFLVVKKMMFKEFYNFRNRIESCIWTFTKHLLKVGFMSWVFPSIRYLTLWHPWTNLSAELWSKIRFMLREILMIQLCTGGKTEQYCRHRIWLVLCLLHGSLLPVCWQHLKRNREACLCWRDWLVPTLVMVIIEESLWNGKMALNCYLVLLF